MAIALHFVFYNFCRIHKALRKSPAMAAGVSHRLWSLEHEVDKIDEAAPAPPSHARPAISAANII